MSVVSPRAKQEEETPLLRHIPEVCACPNAEVHFLYCCVGNSSSPHSTLQVCRMKCRMKHRNRPNIKI